MEGYKQHNPRAGDDFVLILKELQLPGEQRRPYSVWMAGEYPRALDGLCKLLSLDMRVIDPAWVGMNMEAYVFAGAIYWFVCFGLSQWSRGRERRLQVAHGR